MSTRPELLGLLRSLPAPQTPAQATAGEARRVPLGPVQCRITESNLRRKLGLVGDLLGAGLQPDDIAAFVRTRNELAHHMRFKRSGGTPNDQYRDVRYVVDRMLVGLLRYEGQFIDCRSLKDATTATQKGWGR